MDLSFGQKTKPVMPHVSVFCLRFIGCVLLGRGWDGMGDEMGVAEKLSSVLGVCLVMMSCVMLSILLYELLCISDLQSGLLSLPSIIHSVSLELAHTQTHTRAHARAHTVSPPTESL